MPNNRRAFAALSWRRRLLQVGVAIYRDLRRSFKHVHVFGYVHIQKLTVDEQEAFGISQTGKLRKIVGLDFSQTRWPDLGHTRRFVQGKPAGYSRIVKFFPKTFYRHRWWRLNGGVEIDQNLARFRAFAGT